MLIISQLKLIRWRRSGFTWFYYLLKFLSVFVGQCCYPAVLGKNVVKNNINWYNSTMKSDIVVNLVFEIRSLESCFLVLLGLLEENATFDEESHFILGHVGEVSDVFLRELSFELKSHGDEAGVREIVQVLPRINCSFCNSITFAGVILLLKFYNALT